MAAGVAVAVLEELLQVSWRLAVEDLRSLVVIGGLLGVLDRHDRLLSVLEDACARVVGVFDAGDDDIVLK